MEQKIGSDRRKVLEWQHLRIFGWSVPDQSAAAPAIMPIRL